MESPMDQLLMQYLHDKEKQALQVIYRGFGVENLHDFSTKFTTIRSVEELKQSTGPTDLSAWINDAHLIQLLEQLSPDTTAFAENPHLPIRETFQKVIRFLILKVSYEIAGLQPTLELLEVTERELLKALAIEGLPANSLDMMEELGERLKEIDQKEKLEDWPYSRAQLNTLGDFLFKEGYIDSREIFMTCFKLANSNPDQRIIWKHNNADLVYLAYKLWDKPYPQQSHIIAQRRFKSPNGPYNAHQLRRQYHAIKYECEKDSDVIKRRLPLRDALKEIFPDN